MADDILATLTYDEALNFVGRKYRIDDKNVELTVTHVVRAADLGRRPKELKRDGFSIFFQGPGDVLLQQRTYDFPSLGSLFIVPVGKSSEGYEYEAVFT